MLSDQLHHDGFEAGWPSTLGIQFLCGPTVNVVLCPMGLFLKTELSKLITFIVCQSTWRKLKLLLARKLKQSPVTLSGELQMSMGINKCHFYSSEWGQK